MYVRCPHTCHATQFKPELLGPDQLARAAEQASLELTRYFRSSTSWRGYGHAAAIAEKRP